MLYVVRDFFGVQILEADLRWEGALAFRQKESVPPLDLWDLDAAILHWCRLFLRKCQLARLDNDGVNLGLVQFISVLINASRFAGLGEL